ncbi:MAG: DUF1273 family protein [Clostridia bacterium]|nr:DUF1273 family protein [Clostridia bacterium]
MSAINVLGDEVDLVKKYTACVSGHRRAYDNILESDVREKFVYLIEKGYDTFLVGMAVGFDLYCFKILRKLKEEYNFRIIACVPCKKQDEKFNKEQKKEYKKALENADDVILVSKEYTPYCMLKRNRFMVDNSTALVCYIRQNSGGTKYTLDYAKRKNLEIIKV